MTLRLAVMFGMGNKSGTRDPQAMPYILLSFSAPFFSPVLSSFLSLVVKSRDEGEGMLQPSDRSSLSLATDGQRVEAGLAGMPVCHTHNSLPFSFREETLPRFLGSREQEVRRRRRETDLSARERD